MTIQTIDQAKKLFARSVNKGQEWLDKSHPAVIYAMDLAVEEQDVEPINAIRATLADTMPVLIKRLDDYVTSSLDGITVKAGKYDDGGEQFDWHGHAAKSIAWCTKDRLQVEKKPAKPVDPRKAINVAVRKMAESGLAEQYDTAAKRDQAAKILAKCKADLEAVIAGTYGAQAKPVEVTGGNVTNIKAA